MSNQTKKELTVTLEGFGGIDATAAFSDRRIAERLLNFRIRKDGSLEKRCGYRLLADLGSPILASWNGIIQGNFRCYLTTANGVYSLDTGTQRVTLVGSFPAPIPHACFFFYRGALYLMDGKEFREIRNDTLVESQGYVPLVAFYANNRGSAEPREPRNLLTRRARVDYVIGEPTSIFLPMEKPLASVDAVVINGDLIDPSRFYYDEKFQTVNVTEMTPGDYVTAYVTYAEEPAEALAPLLSCTDAVLFGGANRNRLFLWGNGNPGELFCSSYVPKEELAKSKRVYPESNPLYFPEGHEFTIGDSRCHIQGALPHYDRLLIFTEGDAWMVSEGSTGLDEFPATNINAKLGCASTGGVTLAENDPISVGYGTVWKWTGETDRLTERNATRISEAVDPLLTDADYQTMGVHYFHSRNELWLNVKSRQEFWIYHLRYKKWYRFGSIAADALLDANGTPAFRKDGKVFLFDETLFYDLPNGSTPRVIQAEYLSPLLDFDEEGRKNLTALTLRGKLGGGILRFSFTGRGIPTVAETLFDGAQENSILSRRLSSGGFSYGQVGLTSPDTARPVIHSLTLRAR